MLAAGRTNDMASNATADLMGKVHRWIERKPLTEAVLWTNKEKYWLIIATRRYGTNDWKSVAQVVRNAGEDFRPKDVWYTPSNCERQFKIIMSNACKEIKSLPPIEMLNHISQSLRKDYSRDLKKSTDALEVKYREIASAMNRLSQGNLSRNEVASLYSQARRIEVDGKQYMEQLVSKQNASLITINSSSGLPEEPIKWNTPSAPLLTSLLRSRNTIPANRTATTITSLLQSPGGTSRTRSGKLLPLASCAKTSQGTPTLSKLLEAPANPYIPSPPPSTQKNKTGEVVETEKVVGNNSRKENSQPLPLNRVSVDALTITGSFSQINKSDLSASKRQTLKTPISSVKNISKVNSNVVNLLSDSENEDECPNPIQSQHSINVLEEKKDNVTTSGSCSSSISGGGRIILRATRSQTRGGFKQLNDGKLPDEKKEPENWQQQSEESQMTGTHSIDDDLVDIDQIEVEPLSSVQDEIITTPTPPKVTRSSIQIPRVHSPGEKLITNKLNSKEISNEMLEEISANFVLNSNVKSVASEYKNVMVGQSRVDNPNITGCLIPVDSSAVKDAILIRKDGQPFSNPGNNSLTTFDGKLMKQKRIIELKGGNIRCIDGKNDSKFLSFANQPIVVVNKLKKPFNIKLSSEVEDKIDNTQVTTNDSKNTIRLNNSSQNLVQLLDGQCSFNDDEVIIIDDDVNINVDDKTVTKTKELSSNTDSKKLPLTDFDANDNTKVSGNSQSADIQLDAKKNKNNQSLWNVFGKTQNLLSISTKKSGNQDGVFKTGINSNTSESNNRFIKELDFDFDQSISQTSLSELYSGVEEIVEMHSFDNEELNSLIECGSVDNSGETEKHKNVISLDQGDSSVSESDSTIGAFDTFAQITRVPQKSSSKIQILSKESKTVKQDGKNLDHGETSVQSDEIDDDQNSVVSVTGIPILQGVISDVMSKIDSDRVAALKAVDSKSVLPEDIVEISSGEEEEIVNEATHLSSNNFEQNKPQICDKNITFIKLKEDEMAINQDVKITHKINDDIKTKTIENNISKNENKDIIVNIPDTMSVKSHNNNLTRESSINRTKTDIVQPIREIEEGKNVEPVMKTAKDIGNKSTDNDTTGKENDIIKTEVKIVKESELKINEEKSICEESLNNAKDTDESKEKDQVKITDEVERIGVVETEIEAGKKNIEEIRSKDLRKKTKEMDVKEAEKREFEAEIIKRVNATKIKSEVDAEMRRKTNIKKMELRKTQEVSRLKTKEIESSIKAKEIEETKLKETESQILEQEATQKTKEVEIQAKEAEILLDKETKIQKAKVAEILRAKELLIQQAKETEVQKANEVETQKAKAAEIQQAKDAEIQAKEAAEVQRAKDVVQRTKEAELRIAKEVEIKRKKDEEIKRAIEEEMLRAKEEETKKAKEVELRKTKEAEIKKAQEEAEFNKAKEEAEIKKAKEIEQRKAEEAEIKEQEEKIVEKKEAEFKKIKDIETKEFEIKRVKEVQKKIKNEETEEKSPKEKEVVNLEEKSKKSKKSEQPMLEIKKTETETKELEAEMIKTNELKKIIENDGKKVIETHLFQPKVIITRTRGLKVESNLVSKSMLINSELPIKSLGSTSSYVSSTSSESSTISSCDDRKQMKNVDIDNARNNLDTLVEYDDNDKNSSEHSVEIVKKSNIEVIGKSRTRSSSSNKHGKILEAQSIPVPPKSNLKSEVDTSPKEKLGTRTSTSSHNEVPTTSYKLHRDMEFSTNELSSKTLSDNHWDKQLTVSVVKLKLNEVQVPKSVQCPDNNIVKQQEIKTTNNDHVSRKPIDTNKEPEESKKRGRKRRNVQKKLNSDKSTLQNGASTSKELEPPAKRTRRRAESHENVKESVNKFVEDETRKKVLRIIYNNLCDTSKYLTSVDKQTRDLTPDNSPVIKMPFGLREIRRKIASGEIKKVGDLQIQFLLMSYNAAFNNKSNTVVFNDASNYQVELQDNCRLLKGVIEENNDVEFGEESKTIEDMFDDGDFEFSEPNDSDDDDDDDDDNDDSDNTLADKKTIASILDSIGKSSDESSDSEYALPPHKKRGKKETSIDYSEYEEDSDDYIYD